MLAAGCGRIAFDPIDPIGDAGQPTSDAALSAIEQHAYVKASNTDPGDIFGDAVAVSADGSTIAVGAWEEMSNATGIDGDQANDGFQEAGAAYVFVRAGGTWMQQAYLKASNTSLFSRFGASLALSADGTTLAVGAWGELASAGAVYIFTRGTAWTQQAYIKPSNPNMADFFGQEIALSADGSTLAVGASGEDSNATGIDGNQSDNSAAFAGAVYVFTRSGVTWTQQAYVKASDASSGDNFGSDVALSADGSTLAVGAQSRPSSSSFLSGAVYVFTRAGSTWTEQAFVLPSNTGGGFGGHVELSADGSTLAVGAILEASAAGGIDGNQTDTTAPAAGALYVIARSDATWAQQAYIKASNPRADDRFGSSVALTADGSTLAVGAPLEDSAATGIGGNEADDSASDAGAAYVFTRAAATWTQRAYVKATNTGGGDQFGTSLAMSASGSTLLVGAPREASGATGVDGDQLDNTAPSGAVYVFE